MKTVALAALAIAVSTAAQAEFVLTDKAADLVPLPNRILNGVVSVRNVGSAASAPSLATVVCDAEGRDGCAEARRLAEYTDPAFPNALVVEVPAVAPGHVYNHALPFWDALDWNSGDYEFTIVADAALDVAELNEGNNTGTAVLTEP